MYALPGQTLDECARDLDAALSYGTTHLSLYHLTLEPNTLFAKFPPALPDEDTAYEMQDIVEARTAPGWVSPLRDFGLREAASRGAPQPQLLALRRLPRHRRRRPRQAFVPNRILRQMRHKHPATYMEQALAGNAVQEAREVGADELPFEFMLNALRLTDGVPASSFHDYTGLPLHMIGKQLAAAEKKDCSTPTLP
jgi:oxygen-independent coproporphyrinogen-3 oxidase